MQHSKIRGYSFVRVCPYKNIVMSRTNIEERYNFRRKFITKTLAFNKPFEVINVKF